MWTYNEVAIVLAVAIFLNDYKSMAMSFVTKLNFWRRKLYRIQLDSFLYLSWFDKATINMTSCSSSLFSTDLQRHQYELEPATAMFLNCFCSRIFLKIAEFTFPFYSQTAYNGIVYQWYDVLFVSTSQWFSMIEQFCTINVYFPKIKTKTSKTASCSVSI